MSLFTRASKNTGKLTHFMRKFLNNNTMVCQMQIHVVLNFAKVFRSSKFSPTRYFYKAHTLLLSFINNMRIGDPTAILPVRVVTLFQLHFLCCVGSVCIVYMSVISSSMNVTLACG